MKTLVCDSSSLISLSENCLLWLLPLYNAEFVVPEGVKQEIVDNPMRNEKFEFKAVRLQQALLDGSLKVAGNNKITERANELTRMANALFRYGKHNVKILHGGEAQTIALMEQLGMKTMLIDERTTRLLIEDRAALKSYIEQRTGFQLRLNEEASKAIGKELEGINVVRSSELVAWAFEQGYLKRMGKGPDLLHATLYALKYAGCSITQDEIEQYIQMLT